MVLFNKKKTMKILKKLRNLVWSIVSLMFGSISTIWAVTFDVVTSPIGVGGYSDENFVYIVYIKFF